MTFVDRRNITFDERVEIYKALGNKTRLEIFEKILADGGEKRGEDGRMCITDVAAMFNYSLPTISAHLEILRKAGLITTHKEGKKTFVDINIDRSKKVCKIFQDSVASYEEKHPVSGNG